MELIKSIYTGLEVLFALLMIVILLSYLVSKYNFNKNKKSNSSKIDLQMKVNENIYSLYNDSTKIIKLKNENDKRISETFSPNIDLRYIRSAKVIKDNSEKKDKVIRKPRYTIINNEKGNQNKYPVNF